MAGRPADGGAGDTPTVTRHTFEREVIVVPAIFGVPMQVGSGEGVSAPPSTQPSPAPVESSQHPSDDRVDDFRLESVVLPEVAQSAEPTTKSRAPMEEHDESLAPKRQRGRGQVRDHQNFQLGVQAATVAATDTC